MKNVAFQTLALVTLAGLCACGGHAVGGGSSTGGASGSSSSGGSSGAGGSCVVVDLATYDQSCKQASDCVYIQTGDVCSGQCGCGNAVINASDEGRYEQATASIDWAKCFCPNEPVPQCIDHRCTAHAGPDAGSCVNVDLSTYDQSCQQASDCVYIQSGDVCTGLCRCGNAVVNASEQERYAQAVSSIQPGICNCPANAVPQCIDHRCTIPGPDGGSCVDVDLSTYDQTCKVATDCIDVTAGVLCTGGCACGGSTINIDGEAQYQAAVAAVQTAACPCVDDGVPRCIQNRCTLCGFGPNQPPGCVGGG